MWAVFVDVRFLVAVVLKRSPLPEVWQESS